MGIKTTTPEKPDTKGFPGFSFGLSYYKRTTHFECVFLCDGCGIFIDFGFLFIKKKKYVAFGKHGQYNILIMYFLHDISNEKNGDIMGLFDKMKKLFVVSEENKPQETKSQKPKSQEVKPIDIDRKSIDPAQIDAMQKMPASDNYRCKIYKKYYSSYPIKPFISLDREMNTNWLEQAEVFPKQAIIPVKMMTPFKDGLLPGHIYLLYWMGKGRRKRVPSYFEYKYGIEFEKEKQYLIDNGFLLDDRPTAKGEQAIKAHYDVIETHSPEATSAKKAHEKFADDNAISVEQNAMRNSFTINKTHLINGRNLLLVADCDKQKIFEDIEQINALLSLAKAQFKIRESLIIPTAQIVFNTNFSQKLYTYFEYNPLTASGKQSKFPLQLYITTKDHYEASPEFECFGSIGYFKDNRIGSATLNYWYKGMGYHISLGMIDDKLSIKKIEQSSNGSKMTIYKK